MFRKERRNCRRLPIRLDAELRPVHFHRNASSSGPVIQTQITNVGPGGISVDLPSEQAPGTRYWMSARINGKRVEFYAIVRHVSINVTGQKPVYSHGMAITAALDTVVDEFDKLMKRFVRTEQPLSTPAASAVFDEEPAAEGKSTANHLTLAN